MSAIGIRERRNNECHILPILFRKPLEKPDFQLENASDSKRQKTFTWDYPGCDSEGNERREKEDALLLHWALSVWA